MNRLDSEFFQKLKVVLSKYTNENKQLLQDLMVSISKIYEEFESPKRFKALTNDSQEIQDLRNLLDLITVDKNGLEFLLKELEIIGEEIFLNQYELKLSRIIKKFLKDEKKLSEINIEEKKEVKSEVSKEKSILTLIENFSETIKTFSNNIDIRKIDEKRAKEYDASKYKSVDKIRY